MYISFPKRLYSGEDPWIATDKAAHLGMWHIIARFTRLLLGWFGCPEPLIRPLATAIAIGFGAFWELVIDGKGWFWFSDPEGPSYKDFVYDVIGVTLEVWIWP